MIIGPDGYYVNMKITSHKHISPTREIKDKSIEKNFGEILLKLVDDINQKESKAKELQELAVVSPEEVNVHEVIIAEEEARISLLFAKTVIEKGISAWRDLLNLR